MCAKNIVAIMIDRGRQFHYNGNIAHSSNLNPKSQAVPISKFRILYIAGQHPKQSKKNAYLFCILYFGAFVCVALAGDAIKYRSPDGKFAMRLAGDVSEIVDIKSGKTVLELEEVSGFWAKDSNYSGRLTRNTSLTFRPIAAAVRPRFIGKRETPGLTR